VEVPRTFFRGEEYYHLFLEPMLQCGLEYLEPCIGSGALLLDVGCGEGHKTDALRGLGFTSIGIDIDEERLRAARRRYPAVTFVRGDAHDLPFADETFDVVFSHSVMQYTDSLAAIRECRRVLRHDGRAVFIENLEGNPLARVYRSLRRRFGVGYPEYQTPRAHITWGRIREFQQLFSRFEVDVFHLSTPILLALPGILSILGDRPMFVSARWMFRPLYRLDRRLLAGFPGLRRNAWLMVARARR